MKNLSLALTSRTFWTVVVLFLVSGVGAIKTFIPTEAQPLVDGFLALLAIYFHLNPSQNYNG
jgi:hypothetical protein